MRGDRNRAGALARQRDARRVTPECVGVLANPGERELLIEQTVVPREVTDPRQEAKGTDAVVEAHDHHVLGRRETRAVVQVRTARHELGRTGTRDERAAVDEHQHRATHAVAPRRPHVDAQAVLVHSGGGRGFESGVLRAPRPEGARRPRSVPWRPRDRRPPATVDDRSLGVRYAEERLDLTDAVQSDDLAADRAGRGRDDARWAIARHLGHGHGRRQRPRGDDHGADSDATEHAQAGQNGRSYRRSVRRTATSDTVLVAPPTASGRPPAWVRLLAEGRPHGVREVLAGTTARITGASSGIGWALAKRLATSSRSAPWQGARRDRTTPATRRARRVQPRSRSWRALVCDATAYVSQ